MYTPIDWYNLESLLQILEYIAIQQGIEYSDTQIYEWQDVISTKWAADFFQRATTLRLIIIHILWYAKLRARFILSFWFISLTAQFNKIGLTIIWNQIGNQSI